MTPTIEPPKSKIDEYFRVDDTTIFGFFKEYRFLSNFHISPVIYEGLEYTSSEAAYQAAKLLSPIDRMAFTKMTPKESRSEGQKVALRPDWNQVKLKVMTDVLYSKFSLSPELQVSLLATESKVLHEANHWGDSFWGICPFEDSGAFVGHSWLGKILMGIRNNFAIINPKTT